MTRSIHIILRLDCPDASSISAQMSKLELAGTIESIFEDAIESNDIRGLTISEVKVYDQQIHSVQTDACGNAR